MNIKLDENKKRIKAKERMVKIMKEITESSGDLQINHTPPQICEMMLDKVDLRSAENVLVLFNIELVYELFMRDYQGDVYYFTQSLKEVDFVRKLIPNVIIKYIDKEKSALDYMSTWPEKFDIIVSNPPYSKNLHLKFLEKSLDLGEGEIIFVHPSTQYVEGKGSNVMYSDHINKISPFIEGIVLFNGNQIFNIGLFVPCCITHINKNKSGSSFRLINRIYNSDEILHINYINKLSIWGYSKELESIRVKILESLKNSVNLHDLGNVLGSRQERKRKKSQDNLWIVEITHIRGHTNISSDMSMLKDDFFTLTKIENKPIEDSNPKYNIWWEFKTETEANNFLNYIKTDFARTCLALVKVNQNLYNGELKFIPAVDFSREWTDPELYELFGITEEEQGFIKEIIPPYYD